jgi:hypothetical protein
MILRLLAATMYLAGICIAQTPSSTPVSGAAQADTNKRAHTRTSAKHDVGSGAGDIGKGAAKGLGSAATGAGKAAIDLATLHPIGAATDLGNGAVSTGRNVGVGALKGTGKMLRGTGKAIKHLL